MTEMSGRRQIRKLMSTVKSAGRRKVFCIGFNKTGTTTIKRSVRELGFVLGDQRLAEPMLRDWHENRYEPILRYCRSAQVFQDVPFSLPGMYEALDTEFPGSRYILTVRDSSEQWYASITRFHGKLWGGGKVPPSYDQLAESDYVYKGWPADFMKWIFGTPEDKPYDLETLIACYDQHTADVKDYFAGRPDDLLVLNVAESGAYQALCAFLDVAPRRDEFLWENKTD